MKIVHIFFQFVNFYILF